MTWKGKGKGSGKHQGQVGQWVWQPDYSQQQQHGSKGQGNGKGKGKGDANASTNAKVDKMQAKINQLNQQLTQLSTSQMNVAKNTAQVLDQGKKIIGQDTKEVAIVCPACKTEHTNPLVHKCRNKLCRRVLRPGSVPEAAVVKPKEPWNPLLANKFQMLLQEAGAVECLQENIRPPVEVPVQAPEDPDEDMEPADDDKRAQQEELLRVMKLGNAEPAVIRHQEKIIEGLPKPRKVKQTQPILDVGKLHQALSEAAEYHDRIKVRDAETIATCEQVIADAQTALVAAKAAQAEHLAKATKQLEELQTLIHKKQEESKQVLPPATGTLLVTPPTQEQADMGLLMQDFQNWIQKASCPPHLQEMLKNIEMRPVKQNVNPNVTNPASKEAPPTAEMTKGEEKTPGPSK